ncbi:MAG TPA: isochorismatase family cysteine hydrolase [Nitrososphaeraceae archaeon]|nr:isochorismatase family cysteine hydrolase [Nitrososphaeraceae archaeon]
MRNIEDKIVYDTIEEITDPSHTALVVWDVQNMLVNRIFNRDEFTNNLNFVIDLARTANVPIFFTRIQILPKRFESPARLYTLSKLGFDRTSQTVTKEDFDFAVKPIQLRHQQQQQQQEEEIVIDKHTASVFVDTAFERMLRNAGIITVVFTGIATEFGIESSARDASNRGFYSVVISDCVSSPDRNAHERSIENMRKIITIMTSKDVENSWSK